MNEGLGKCVLSLILFILLPALVDLFKVQQQSSVLICLGPRFSWNKGRSFPQLPFGVKKLVFEVAIIWPDMYNDTLYWKHHLYNNALHEAHITLQGTNISPTKALLKMIFLFPRWDMLIPWRVCAFFWFPPLGIRNSSFQPGDSFVSKESVFSQFASQSTRARSEPKSSAKVAA